VQFLGGVTKLREHRSDSTRASSPRPRLIHTISEENLKSISVGRKQKLCSSFVVVRLSTSHKCVVVSTQTVWKRHTRLCHLIFCDSYICRNIYMWLFSGLCTIVL